MQQRPQSSLPSETMNVNEEKQIRISCDGVQDEVECRSDHRHSEVDDDEEFEHFETAP